MKVKTNKKFGILFVMGIVLSIYFYNGFQALYLSGLVLSLYSLFGFIMVNKYHMIGLSHYIFKAMSFSVIFAYPLLYLFSNKIYLVYFLLIVSSILFFIIGEIKKRKSFDGFEEFDYTQVQEKYSEKKEP